MSSAAGAIPPSGEYSDYNLYQNFTGPISRGTTADFQDAKTMNQDSSDFSKESEESTPFINWCIDNGAIVSAAEIEDQFFKLGEVFGFQDDNVLNMFDYFMNLLDSRASRTSCSLALLSLHSDYIGGPNSNYKKWYFSAQFELDENISIKGRTYNKRWSESNKIGSKQRKHKTPYSIDDLEKDESLLSLEYRWRLAMSSLTEQDYIVQVGLYLLIWGEANNLRFMPECICFIYKTALDYYNAERAANAEPASKCAFLDRIVTPLYEFIRDQQYKLKDGQWIRRDKDHSDIIGYDDINQFFWLPENISKIKTFQGQKLLSFPREERYTHLKDANWKKVFYKTYCEKRTWIHLLPNFSRVWIIHVSMFWFYTSFNSSPLYTKNYNSLLDNQPAIQIQWTTVSLGGAIAVLISLLATFSEWAFVPRKWPGSKHLTGRFIMLLILFLINFLPTCYIYFFIGWNVNSKMGTIIAIGQLFISLATFLYLAIVPPNLLFGLFSWKNASFVKSQIFTSSFPSLPKKNRIFSSVMWICIFLAKFFESYFFLTLSVRDPIRELATMDLSRCRGDLIFGNMICRHQAKFILFLLYLTNMILFFLDTYLWYVICNCIFSICLSFSLGNSVFSPWRNIFSRLPERIYSKIINCKDTQHDSIFLTAQVWNSIILSMYREHILSIEQVSKLIFLINDDENFANPRKLSVRPPLFFVFQDDNNSLQINDFFTPNKDAERRISFFAQSLSSRIPEPIPIEKLPSFSVLVPHHSEKVILGLKEIIKEDPSSKVSLLDYLKKLHPTDWDNFVRDTKVLTLVSSSQEPEQSKEYSDQNSAIKGDVEDYLKSQIDDLPYYCVGFKNSQPESTLRTRIWASLRYQTLYRTISGFMNYDRVLRLLYKLEKSDIDYRYSLSNEDVEEEMKNFSTSKFRLLIAMQKFQKFSKSELEDAKVLFETYPELQVAYLEEEVSEDEKTIIYYSTLLELSNKDEDGNYAKKYRIKLSGNPILGDGKSDNQNHSVIFTRGEYIQVIDANQDNYLEECLKIKSVLAEFEEMEIDPTSHYIPGIVDQNRNSPVAIVGAREYIFSEHIGVLGDIAAGKEQTFGTLFARTLAGIGGKLHYGHPDFINNIFMNTRGGLSKAQKGLHINEDIYAGINAVSRGGIIKHSDFYQCGKGRDLGFGTILNFTTKIGAGMGEQILSRELYYLGTSLPIDRFLSFYYAHAGFHINNLFIILSVQLFMVVLVNLGSLNHETIKCQFNKDVPHTDIHQPLGCYNLQPVLNWVTRFVLSVFICFFISFTPLIIQEITEKGFVKALMRVVSHFFSLSPFFEVFVCRIYARSLSDNIAFGGAKYVATGRGFAISRVRFTALYSRYASQSIYGGAIMFMMVLFATLSMWQPSILWFWISVLSLCLGPFIFNPHQFSFQLFFLDYRDFMHWLFRGNRKWHRSSWNGFVKMQRSRFTGYKTKNKEGNSSVSGHASKLSGITSVALFPLLGTLGYLIPYLFINSQTGVRYARLTNPLMRIMVISLLPIVLNLLCLLVFYPISCILGPLLSWMFAKLPSIIAGTALFTSVVIQIVTVQVLLVTHNFNITRSLCGFIFIANFHKFLLHLVLLFGVSKEFDNDATNRAWWSGKWIGRKLGWLIITQPFRELVVKVCEMNQFAYDFILGHILHFTMIPIVFIPFIDQLHTCMLFWLKPSKQFRGAILSKRRQRILNFKVFKYFVLFTLILALLIGSLIAPTVVAKLMHIDVFTTIPPQLHPYFQATSQNNNDTGVAAPLSVPRAKPSPIELPYVS